MNQEERPEIRTPGPGRAVAALVIQEEPVEGQAACLRRAVIALVTQKERIAGRAACPARAVAALATQEKPAAGGGFRYTPRVIPRRRLHRAVFILAGLYNIGWGIFSAVDPQWLFRFAGMPLSPYPEIFACLAMVVGLYGILYPTGPTGRENTAQGFGRRPMPWVERRSITGGL